MIKKVLLLLIVSVSGLSLFSKDFEVIVIDRDLDFPLEGVRLTNADTGTEYYTDFDGKAVLELPDNIHRLVLIAELIGYEPRKQLITDFSSPLEVFLLMEGVLEGQELVVEVEAIGETDQEVGVSTVIEKEIIESASKMGIIEDVMNAVKILPGVSYSGGFGSQMSVRGGDPSGLTAVMDGFVVKYPNHWGGAFSIFNPNIVESIKFSPGIFSAKHGQATSALLEVNTVDPTDGLKYSGILSTSTIEAFGQFPLGKDDNFGVLAGFRLTNYDIALKTVELVGETFSIDALTDTTAPISRAPYIYDFYLKTLYAPTNSFRWHLNGFWGNDGIGVSNVEIGDKTTEIANGFEFFYENSDFFVNSGLQILPTNNLLLNVVVGYENYGFDVEGEMSEEGYKEYSDEFISEFGSIIPEGAEGFEVYTNSIVTTGQTRQSFQARMDLDWSINDNYLLQSGFGSNMDISTEAQDGTMWSIYGNPPVYDSNTYKQSSTDQKLISSFIYTNVNAHLIPDTLKMDLGCRLDHYYFIGEDDFTLDTKPEFAPRVNFTLSQGINTFSLGTGLFNKNPFTAGGFDKDLNLDDFTSEKTLMAVLGWERPIPNDIRFKVEGYYKYVFDRFYYNTILKDDGNYLPIMHFDGYGNIGGGDLLLEKKVSRYLDGLFSYTYVYARYMEPEDDDANGLAGAMDSRQTRGQFYYPSFHRFHTMNLLLNYKPTPKFTFTTKLSFATGNPKSEDGETTMFAALVNDRDGNIQVAEMYSRESYYSDTLRTNFALPLDLKCSWHNYLKDSKYEWEFYIAIQDALSPLLTALQESDATQTSKWYGDSEEAPDSGFSFPIPSIGFSLSF